jgi:hypothetical protein
METLVARTEKTSTKVASTASDILRSPTASKTAKSIAGSALSQTRTAKTTSSQVASKASKALDTTSASKAVKAVAGSVLTQKPGRK